MTEFSDLQSEKRNSPICKNLQPTHYLTLINNEPNLLQYFWYSAQITT